VLAITQQPTQPLRAAGPRVSRRGFPAVPPRLLLRSLASRAEVKGDGRTAVPVAQRAAFASAFTHPLANFGSWWGESSLWQPNELVLRSRAEEELPPNTKHSWALRRSAESRPQSLDPLPNTGDVLGNIENIGGNRYRLRILNW